MISAEDVKKLRQASGVSVMECKRALKESDGDFEKAKAILESRGAKVAEKKSTRETKAGLVEAYIHANGKVGAMVEVFCETDFVARNDNFKALAHDIAMQVVATSPKDKEELLSLPFIKDSGVSVKEQIDKTIALLGENINLGSFSRFEL